QYAIYRHNDRDHDHIHICTSRISLDDGKITSDSWEYVRSEKIIRQLELEYGLQQTNSSKEKLHRAPSIGQQRRLEREQLEYEQGLRDTAPQQPIKTQLIELIDRATADKPTMPQLVERLQLQGVEVRHGLTRNGKSKGISYSWNDHKFSGTSLGAAYTFPGLQKHKGIDYQPQRDDGRIQQLLLNRVKSVQIDQVQKLTQDIVQAETLAQFVLPAADEEKWDAVHEYLTQQRGLPSNLVSALKQRGLLYADDQHNAVFGMRSLGFDDNEIKGALRIGTKEQDNTFMEYAKGTRQDESWFYLGLKGNKEEVVQRVFLCDSPIEAISMAQIDSENDIKARTLYIAVDSVKSLPVEFLKKVPRIGVTFGNDATGEELSSAVMEVLPQAKIIDPPGLSWNEMLVEQRQIEQLESEIEELEEQYRQPSVRLSR
ncbi:relaxase/mobilization nuclease domain-containing protein, partial [Halotia wernerae UHCC 0503]|nr:relaxase/mobilization nuclease domain-containing protein [Halotia wernerae UHCC 0503]